MKIIEVSADGVVRLQLDKRSSGEFVGMESMTRMMSRGNDVGVHWNGPTTGDWWKGWDEASPLFKGRRTMAGVTLRLTEDHIKLLRASYMGWSFCEFGAVEVNPKRPYGNSDVLGDIAEIIGIDSGEDDEFTDEQSQRMMCLHREMQAVFEIVSTQQLELGNYKNVAGPYLRPRWVLHQPT